MPDILLRGNGVTVEALPATAQWLLQCAPADAPAIGAAAGLALPAPMLASGTAAGWHALHVSPEAWLLIADADADGTVLARLPASGRALSLVDVSDRSLALRIGGPAAPDLLAAACPLDLERFAEGGCTHSLLGKVTVLFWRRGAADWWISYSRSCHDYVLALMTELVADLLPA